MHHQNIRIADYKANPNLSLMFYKYTPKLNEDRAKLNFLRAFSRKFPLKPAIDQRLEVFRSCNCELVELENNSKFMCGIGYVNNIEWGFNFDWTTGMPYLPGSSFKGALLSYLEFAAGNQPVEKWNNTQTVDLVNGDEWSKKEVFSVFGPQGKNIEKADTGAVIFYDVYPSHFKGFDVDVITPHYKSYYVNEPQNRKSPADTENPIPIHFLTLKPGSIFNFFFKIRKEIDEHDDMNSRLKKLIIEAGENYGFGAKTSSGYGFFKSFANIK